MGRDNTDYLTSPEKVAYLQQERQLADEMRTQQEEYAKREEEEQNKSQLSGVRANTMSQSRQMGVARRGTSMARTLLGL